MRVLKRGETLNLTGEFVGEAHRILECTQTQPPRNQHLKGYNPFVGSEGSDGKWGQSGARKQHCSLSDSSPRDSATTQQRGLSHPGKYLRLHSSQHNRCAQTKKYGPSERTDRNSRRRTKWWGGRQPVRCRVLNTGNQDAHRNGWVQSQNEGRNEGYTKWNKAKYITVKGRKLGPKSMIWNKRKK